MILPKIKVQADTKQGWKYINKKDYDKDIYTLYVPEKIKTRKPKKTKLQPEQIKEKNADIILN